MTGKTTVPHETEAGDAGMARRIADKPPRQDRDGWEEFDLADAEQTRADTPPPVTPAD